MFSANHITYTNEHVLHIQVNNESKMIYWLYHVYLNETTSLLRTQEKNKIERISDITNRYNCYTVGQDICQDNHIIL